MYAAILVCHSKHCSSASRLECCGQALRRLLAAQLPQGLLQRLRMLPVCGRSLVSFHMPRKALQETEQRLCAFCGPGCKPGGGNGTRDPLHPLQRYGNVCRRSPQVGEKLHMHSISSDTSDGNLCQRWPLPQVLSSGSLASL